MYLIFPKNKPFYTNFAWKTTLTTLNPPKNHTFLDRFYMNLIPIYVTHVQCSTVKKGPFYVNFWTSLITPLTFECPPPPGLESELEWRGHIPQSFQGQSQEFSIEGAQTLFKKKSGSAWGPTHSKVPCLCKNKMGRGLEVPPPPNPHLVSQVSSMGCKDLNAGHSLTFTSLVKVLIQTIPLNLSWFTISCRPIWIP